MDRHDRLYSEATWHLKQAASLKILFHFRHRERVYKMKVLSENILSENKVAISHQLKESLVSLNDRRTKFTSKGKGNGQPCNQL